MKPRLRRVRRPAAEPCSTAETRRLRNLLSCASCSASSEALRVVVLIFAPLLTLNTRPTSSYPPRVSFLFSSVGCAYTVDRELPGRGRSERIEFDEREVTALCGSPPPESRGSAGRP